MIEVYWALHTHETHILPPSMFFLPPQFDLIQDILLQKRNLYFKYIRISTTKLGVKITYQMTHFQ